MVSSLLTRLSPDSWRFRVSIGMDRKADGPPSDIVQAVIAKSSAQVLDRRQSSN